MILEIKVHRHNSNRRLLNGEATVLSPPSPLFNPYSGNTILRSYILKYFNTIAHEHISVPTLLIQHETHEPDVRTAIPLSFFSKGHVAIGHSSNRGLDFGQKGRAEGSLSALYLK